jgi:three-Cys-motif partner protein
MQERFDPIIDVQSDGLLEQDAREWALRKYRLVGTYCDIFTGGMHKKWKQLVYVDLFAGAGHTRIQEGDRIVRNAALVAMSVPHPFTKYILCEKNELNFQALKVRVERDFAHLDCVVLHCDSNTSADRILRELPPYSAENNRLAFCFVDPYSLDLNFGTIRALGGSLVDFLILQALQMDGNRNVERYIDDENTRIAKYLGKPDWRARFDGDTAKNRGNFIRFLADEYQDQMRLIGYQEEKLFEEFRSTDKNLPLYYMAYYSKHRRGSDFFKEVSKRLTDQLTLGF